MSRPPPLGVIEGYFGKPWSFADRAAVIATLAPAGYSFYHYAPKADAFLRRQWRDPYPDDVAAALAGVSAHARAHGMRFGMGLSPYAAFADFNAETRAALIKALTAIGLDDLAIFFDDMPVSQPDLAARQIAIVHEAAAAAPGLKLLMCPSFYSDDSVLARVFGVCPPAYLEDLGAGLDPAIGAYWTGEEVCAREFSRGHLARVADQLRRKPTLWDNYPVNDGPRMSRFLHLRGFTGRPAEIAADIAAHAINPALQPHLSCIPALTLVESYRTGPDYAYMQAFRSAAQRLAGAEIAAALEADLLSFQDAGLDRLSETRKAALREKWAALHGPYAAEITAWLDGAYAIGAEELQTQ
jgi:hyaluronoglucosaminidase